MNSKAIILSALSIIAISSGCQKSAEKTLEGKIKRETIGLTTKVPGRIERLFVKEGDVVRKGDTLAILDIPEVNAKIAQAKGAVKSAVAQYDMAENGATANQLKQLEAKYRALKEQYEFAQKSFKRVQGMFADSLIAPQKFDEASAKYQGARSQFDAVKAELDEARKGVRTESKVMALGQKERADGALQEANVAFSERYIIAPTDMTIETIALHEGELATPGYAIFNGYLPLTTYFRFTMPESKIGSVKKGEEISIYVPYLKQEVKAKVGVIKQLTKYADITTAYPDYQMEESIYEVKLLPTNINEAEKLLANAAVTIPSNNHGKQ